LEFFAGTLEELACLFAGIDTELASSSESSVAGAVLLVAGMKKEY